MSLIAQEVHMSARKIIAAFTFACSSIAFLPSNLRAQEAVGPVTPDVENSKFQFEGRINSSAVYIRSGPSDNDYPTMKLDRDASITVVGEKFAWLKIQPPKDSFCYVAKAYVEKRGNGNVGRVTQPLNVRVGSNLNPMKTKIATKLDAGQDVQIIGEQDEYFKIAPPDGVFVYVNKQFVDPVRAIAQDQPAQDQPAQDQPVPGGQAGASADGAGNQQPGANPPGDSGAMTTNTPQVPPTDQQSQPAQIADASQQKPDAPVIPPTTQPVESSTAKAQMTQQQAEQEFDRLSTALSVASHQTLDQQPLEELQAGFEKLVASNQLPNTLQIRAESDLAAIRSRVQDKTRYAAVLKQQEEMKQNRLALEEERRELEKRIANSSVQTYTALGTLRLSSLQNGAETLYRLTDPRTGSTLVYIRSNDQQLAQMVGQFIGVRGPIADDSQLQLKVITLDGAEVVDPSKVNTRVLAPIVPPSMLPQSGTAKTE
jgi:uncharacterized protein YgiM (DUF1202 family)